MKQLLSFLVVLACLHVATFAQGASGGKDTPEQAGAGRHSQDSYRHGLDKGGAKPTLVGDADGKALEHH
jgi:hypothetical protein